MRPLPLLLPPLLFLSLPLLGCPPPAGGDDDDSDDDDDTPAPWCEGVEAEPIDLRDPQEVVGLVMTLARYAPVGLFVAETTLTMGDGVCPAAEGDDFGTTDIGTVELTGGCSAASGYGFEGVAVVHWDAAISGRVEVDVESTDWVVQLEAMPGRGVGFERVALDGTLSIQSLDFSTRGGGESDRLEVEGLMMTRFPPGVDPLADLLDELYPAGFDGSLLVANAQGADYQEGELDIDAEVRCRSHLRAVAAWSQDSTVCDAEPTTGTITLTAEGRTVVLSPETSSACDGCIPWSIDGIEQQEPLCFEASDPPRR